MTPAIDQARRAGVTHQVHEYPHDPRSASYGLEAAECLGVPPERVFKTLVVALDGDPKRLAVGVVPVIAQLDLKAMAKACRAKKAGMADPTQAERATGYLVGGISPLGQKRRLPLLHDGLPVQGTLVHTRITAGPETARTARQGHGRVLYLLRAPGRCRRDTRLRRGLHEKESQCHGIR